ncbi:MAG: HAMP domain-containing sensor histidine kinase, partial [Actinomycetota bacterium]|nr:HAMP domain-containing sensor histidine kinase [Actinomycetota bacterium]
SLLLVPLGAGPECLGRMLMFRRDRADWSDEEADTALDMGHDLGRAVLNARSFAREQHAAVYTQQLIATMAHELQNPLAAARGYASILEDVLGELGVDDPDAEKSLRGLDRAGGRLVDIVTDLLALARATEEVDPTACDPVDIAEVVRDSVEIVSVQAAPRGIAVVMDVPDRPLLVRGEPGDLERVASNLVGNAVKYSPDGTSVRVSLAEDPHSGQHGEVVLRVADQGIGISAADQERLFEEFFRSEDPEAVRQPGTGLGLAIVKRVVDRHRGTISVRSAPREGSTFTVRLPRADA